MPEAVINAVCPREYTIALNVEVRIYDDRLVVFSPRELPFGSTVADLYKPHSFALRNKGVAGIFYDVGLIEKWGSGIDKMRRACVNAGVSEPQFEEHQGFRVIFRKDLYTEEYLRQLGLNERQIKAVGYVREKGKITNKKYREMFGIAEETALRDLSDLLVKAVLAKGGKTGRNAEYILIPPNPP